MANLEEVSGYPLDEAQLEELFAVQRLCTVCWSTADGWPVGVTHRYLWHDGKIWVTTTSQRHRVNALRNGEGTDFGPDRTVTLKTTCQVHEDRETLEWFFAAFSEAMHPGNEAAKAGFVGMMDTPRRVVLELTPVKTISYDGGKLADAIVREGLG
jgi:hypothetical protein